MRYVFLVLLSVLLASCTIVNCDDPIVHARLVGFSKQELDSIEVIRYVKGSEKPVDTVIKGYSADTVNYTDFVLKSYKDHDFSVRVINTGHVYKLTSLSATPRKYNYGLMRMARLCSNLIKYKLNSISMKVDGSNYCEYNYCHTYIDLQQ